MAASSKKLPLQERVPVGRTAWRLADLAVLSLLLALLARRAAWLLAGGAAAPKCWVIALVCETWFTFVWLLNMNVKWNPVLFKTHPERLSDRMDMDELPSVDMFVTTADPKLEPPVVTANTVLSLLATDYPAGKLACYVSDDGCSPVTFYALREAAEFAKLWVPFCRRHNVGVRAPFVYFSSGPDLHAAAGQEFLAEWTSMKSEYEKLVRLIENADEASLVRCGDGEFAEFRGVQGRNHPTIIKVLRDSKNTTGEEGFPSLVYVSREKSPAHHHHFKAGAMNVLTRVSAVLTNAPIMLNVDCDMFANNSKVVLHAMCLLLGFDDEVHCGFVQSPQRFYGALKDDPFGNQLVVLLEKVGYGIAGLQGMLYGGTGCFHRRKIIYGLAPNSTAEDAKTISAKGSQSYKELEEEFGSSKEFIEAARITFSGRPLASSHTVDMSSRIEAAKQVSGSAYEIGTSWGREVGWVYGSVTEDVQTSLRIHGAGWRTAMMELTPPAFLGNAPTGGPASLTQNKRWATGLLEILFTRNNPVMLCIFRHLRFRQCLAYLVLHVWAMRAPFELCYALLAPYCLLANQSFLPKPREDGFGILVALFLSYNAYHLMEYVDCRLSARAWWNNQRMQRILTTSAWLLAFLTVTLKTLGLSDTVFEVTRKDSDDDGANGDADPGRFTFDSSPVFVPPSALTMLSVVAIAVGAWRAAAGGASGGPGIKEFVCCGWVVVCFWPFTRGLLVGSKGNYGVPWSVKLKAGLLVAAFVHFCRN